MRYLVAMACCAALSASDGFAMQYRVIETAYGPQIQFNDWQPIEGRTERAGGAVHLIAQPLCVAKRITYPYGGGGDVELSLTFSFDQFADAGEWIVHFNHARDDDHTTGFRVRVTPEHVEAFMRDERIARIDAPTLHRNDEHTLRFATLAYSYAIWLDDVLLASGDMLEPYTDNEGDLLITARHAVVRLIALSEKFIAHDSDPPVASIGSRISVCADPRSAVLK